ncbi:MAG TPA: UDP-N-acetylmuramoyl-tripeptide--D-alanyl-D-alanine ligase [Bryobacteraceae bacterium]|nr:UDP-N-acetylmuramoyl-tripeptide--D-alanyl-D-alanine ligase [Bryobacteraceae bacterium]
MQFPVKQVAAVLGLATALDGQVTGWSTDTRTIAQGDLFFALSGPSFDGNTFVDEALAKGAVAAVVDRNAAVPDTRRLIVPDVLAALQHLAAWARDRWAGDIVAVTGSAGKTSTKEVIADLLSTRLGVGRTGGNLNNHIGLPLSLLRLPADARVGVIEIGMNHAGEIAALAKIAKPRIAVVTNIGYAHVENFEDGIEGVARAKHELVESLPADGIAILNADDPRVALFAHPGETITFGIENDADLRAEDIILTPTGARFRVGRTCFETELAGRHAVLNILAGIAVARVFGIAPAELTEAVARLKPGRMRGERFTHRGILILNDCYNSNPDAARAMIDVLSDTPAERHVAVLGEMLELGRWSETLHRDVGRYAAEHGMSVLVGIRGAARAMVDAAVKAGLSETAAYFFDSPESAGEHLRGIAREGDAVLFKGSRGTRVEKALERFVA